MTIDPTSLNCGHILTATFTRVEPEHVNIFAELWYLADHAHHLQPGGQTGQAGGIERPAGQEELLLVGDGDCGGDGECRGW